jgi:DNA-binding MarR family transcriptional regulator
MYINLIKFVKDTELSCMTARQLAMLELLNKEEQTSAELARNLDLDPPIITKAIKKLFALNLISVKDINLIRENKPDLRKRILTLTPKSRDFFHENV